MNTSLQNCSIAILAFLAICEGVENKSFTISAGTQSFPLTLPGAVLAYKKIYSNGKSTIVSNSNHLKSVADLLALEAKEQEANRIKYGALTPDLRYWYDASEEWDTLECTIYLKWQDGIRYLDKTRHSPEELKKMLRRSGKISDLEFHLRHFASSMVL